MEKQTERTDLETRVKGKRGEGEMDGKYKQSLINYFPKSYLNKLLGI